MTVQELIEILGNYQQDADVHFSYGYGDHWRTQVSPKISEVFEGTVAYSEYHRMDKLIEVDYDNEDEDNEKVRRVVVIG
jgi:hypothetical protein